MLALLYLQLKSVTLGLLRMRCALLAGDPFCFQQSKKSIDISDEEYGERFQT